MSRCGLCNRPLHDRESIALGFGPTCWSRLSAAAGSRPTPASTSGAAVSVVAVTTDPAASGVVASATGAPVPPIAAATSDPTRHESPGASVGATDGAVAPRATDSPALAGLGWLLVLAALVALVEYWRWVVVGLAVLGAVAASGALLEWLMARRAGSGSTRSRSYRL